MSYEISEIVESLYPFFKNPSYVLSVDELEAKIHLVEKEEDYQKLAHLLACNNNVPALKYLVDKKQFPLQINQLLTWAASSDSLQTTQYLIQIGADPTSNDYEALGWAVSNGRFVVAKYIIETGINIQSKNNLLITAIGEAHDNIAYLLLEHNVYYNKEDILNIHWVPQSTKDRFIQYAQDIENRILLRTNEFLKGINRPFEVLIFDGGFIRKLDNETFFPPHILRDMESYILKEMNYKIEFDVKPLNHSFNFVIDNLIPENIIIDDSYGAEQFSKIVEARRVGNDIYIFNPNTERWGCSKTDIDTAIIANKSLLQFKQNSPTGIKLYNYGGCIKNINCMKSLIPMFIKEDKLPIQLEYQFNDIDSNTRVLELFNILLDLLSNNNAI